jgi:hypothetical protein
MTNMLDARYEQIKRKIIDYVADEIFIALTTDLWTNQNLAHFITLTCHCNKGWRPLNINLGTKQLTTKTSTTIDIKREVEDILETFHLEKCECAFVTDGGSNVVAACNLMGKQNFHCFGHLLNLIVQDTFVEKNSLFDKVKNAVQEIKTRIKGTKKLLEIQNQEQKRPLKLISFSKTRWNSIYYMFERVYQLNQSGVVNQVLAYINKSDLHLSNEDMKALREQIHLFKPIHQVTEYLSGQNYITTSKIIPLFRELRERIEDASESRTRTLLLDSIDKRYHERNEWIIASALDPQIKLDVFDDHEKEDVINSIKVQCSWEPQMMQLSQDSQPLLDPATQPTKKRKLNVILDVFEDDKSEEKETQKGNEIERYLSLPLAEKQTNIHDWWSLREKEFPNLSVLAKKFLSIPATSTPSERVFSKMGDLYQKKRCSLGTKRAEKIIFCNQNGHFK